MGKQRCQAKKGFYVKRSGQRWGLCSSQFVFESHNTCASKSTVRRGKDLLF